MTVRQIITFIYYLNCYIFDTLIYLLNYILVDEHDFFFLEDLALVMKQEVYSRDQPEDIPYVQVNRNHPGVNLNDDTVCVVCRDNTRT